VNFVLKGTIFVASFVVAAAGIKSYVDHSVRVVCRRFELELRNLQSDKKTFSEIYRTHSSWGTPEHLSGLGSAKRYTMPCIEYVQKFIDTNKLQTIYDFGCGSYEWMQHVSVPKNVQYYGVDVVESVIQENKRKYEKDNIHFVCIDSTDDFLKCSGDLLIVKDVFECWNIERMQYFFQHVLPNFKYAIMVDYCDPKGRNNSPNSPTGPVSSKDVEAAPFNLKCKESRLYEINFNEKGRKWKTSKKIALWENPNCVRPQSNVTDSNNGSNKSEKNG
jgi:hypothetical protein